MSLKLYYDFLSQPSRALYILLKTSKIPFEPCPVALRKGEQLSEEYKNDISRFQKVPAIKHGDFKLAESVAILRYLAKEKQISDQWYPKQSQARARVDEYLEWQHNNIRTHGALYFRLKFIQPLLTGEQPDPKRIADYEERLANSIGTVEELFLKDTAYIAGDQISAADIWAACELEQPRACGFDPEAGHPGITRWLNKVRPALSPYYEEAHTMINKLAAKAGLKK